MNNFIATEILSSTDNLHYQTVSTESEEQRSQRLKKEEAERQKFAKPLAVQLQENREALEAERKDRLNPFKPPPGLTEEEFAHLIQSEENERKRREEEEFQRIKDQKEFEAKKARMMRSEQVPKQSEKKTNDSFDADVFTSLPTDKNDPLSDLVVKRHKRKKRKFSPQSEISKPEELIQKTVKKQTLNAQCALSALTAYDSD